MEKMTLTRLVVPLVLCGAASFAYGQAVYKCQLQGRTTYSNEPCLGAQVIQTTPARGLGESHENSRAGNDGLRREKREKKVKEPMNSPASDLTECSALDTQEKQQSSVIHNSRNIDAVNAAADAFIANRKRYRELGCR